MTRKKRKNWTVDEWAEYIQPHVAYCITCQPYDGGEAIWILGDQQDMQGFLGDFDVPEHLQDEVASRLFCNNCGASLDMSNDVGTKSAIEREEEERGAENWAAWKTQYEPKLKDFTEFLSKFPYLGCDHEFGRHILNEITSFPTIKVDGDSWWRARKPEGGKRFSPDDLGPPPAAISEGRYNHHGQKVLYLASKPDAAGLEVLGEGENLVWVQEYKLSYVENLLDLAAYVDERSSQVSVLEFGLEHTELHRVPADSASPWKPQYFLPRFIADCARRKGYKGIQFRSHKHIHQNLVLFEWDESQITPIGQPKTMTVEVIHDPTNQVDF